MKRVIQLVLLVVIVILAYILVDSILTPIRFTREYEKRKAVVVEKLKDIRDIQVAYRSERGEYSASFDSLIKFYKEGNITVVRQIGSFDDSIAVAEGRVYRDTVTIPVRDTIFNSKQADFNIDLLGTVPYADVPFELKTKLHKTASQITLPLFEASVKNDIFLKGLDEQEIVNLNDKLEKMEKFPGLRVGSVNQPNNNAGNWE